MITKTIKVKINFQKSDYDLILQTLQKDPIMMLDEAHFDKNENTDTEDEYLERCKKMITILEEYLNKKSFFKYDSISYQKFSTDSSLDIPLLENIEEVYQELQDLILLIKEKNKTLDLLNPFKNLSVPTNAFNNDKYLNLLFGYVPNINDFLYKAESIMEIERLGVSEYGSCIAFCYLKENEKAVRKILTEFEFMEAELPKIDTPLGELVEKVKNEVAAINKKTTICQEKLKAYTKEIMTLKVLADKLLNDKIRKTIKYRKNEESLYLEGYIRELDKDKFTKTLQEATKNCEIEYISESRNEILPTAMINNKFVEPFESITNMFSAPNPNEIDPNPLMSIWYWLFFGFMMGDIGYGIVMIVACGLFLKFKKPKPNIKPLVTIFLYSGFSAIIFGIIFGSFFGESLGIIKYIGELFGQTWPSALLNPVEEPLPVLALSIIIGVFHIICALAMKISLSRKQKDIKGVLYGAGWIGCLSGLLVLIIGMLNILPITIYPGLITIGIALCLILSSAVLEGKGFGRIATGFGGLYKAFSYLSDLLSYSRLLALCLSSAVIAYTMNILAGMLQGSSGIMGIIGFLFSLIVYIIGHVFNLALSLLSSYIHSSRLQYIEYFGKFYIGGGIEFKPLAIELNYLDSIDYKN